MPQISQKTQNPPISSAKQPGPAQPTTKGQKDPLRTLNPRQRQAVEYLEGPLLVLAGPGTGKTQLLSSKVAYILTATDTAPENILCLTFTDSGAANMRSRLYSLIGPAASKVNIHTYHAFGANILAQYRNYSTEFTRALETPIDTVTQYKIIAELQAGLPATDIMKRANPADIIEVISAAKSARLTATDLAHIAQHNLETAAQLNPQLSEHLTHLGKRMKYADAVTQVYRPIMETLAQYTSPEPLAPGVEREANVYLRELSDLITQQDAAERPSVSPLTSWKRRRFERDAAGNYRLKNLIPNLKLQSIAQIMQAYDAYLEQQGLFDFPDMIEQSIKILQTDQGFRLTLSERYQYILLDEFQDTNPSQAELIYLLTDYEKPTVMAVGDDDQAIFAFQGANASNLLDFQEHYQASVVTLTDNYRSTGEILDFSYRVAEQITDSFAKKQGIKKRLRSMRDLAGQGGAPVNASFTPVDAKSTPVTAASTPVSEASAVASSDATDISRHEFPSADAEYYWVAQQVARLVRAGVPQTEIAIIAPKHKYIAPILPYLKAHTGVNIAYEKRDNLFEDPQISQLLTLAQFVADLAAERRPAHRLMEVLSFPFWQVPAIEVVQAVECARAERKSTLDCLATSDSPRLKKIAEFLAQLVVASFDTPLELFLDYLIGTAPLGKFRSPYLEYYTSHQGSTPVHAGPDQIIDKSTPVGANPAPVTDPSTPVSEASAVAGSDTASDYATFQLYENLSVLREAIHAHTHAPHPKLQDLVDFYADYQLAGQALVNTSPYQDSTHAVQVLTAHKAKGLEFSHVFMIAVDDRSWGNAKGNNNMLTLPQNLTQIRHTGITEDECLRLLFVAVTRARSHLTMTNSVQDFSGKAPARLQYLQEVEADGEVASPLVPTTVVRHLQDLSAAHRQTDLRLSWMAAYQQLTPELKPLLLQRMADYRLTASDLTTFIDIAFAGPQTFYQRKVLRAPAEPLTDVLAFGNLIHATFEQVTKSSLSDAAAIDYYCAQAASQPLPEPQIADLIERGRYSLQISLPAFGEILRAGRAEVDLYPEHLAIGADGAALASDKAGAALMAGKALSDGGAALMAGGESASESSSAGAPASIPVTGKIDHITIDEDSKTLEIYDFKTSAFHSEKWDAHPTLYKYKLQLGFYKLLLSLSPSYRQYHIARAHILFVTPDAAGEVYDKVYEFTPAEEAELLALARAVYHQAKTLDFVSDPTLFLPPDPSKTLRDIKGFVGRLVEGE